MFELSITMTKKSQFQIKSYQISNPSEADDIIYSWQNDGWKIWGARLIRNY